MHLNPYGEYAVLLAASLANDWPSSRAGIITRTAQFGMTIRTLSLPGDHLGVRGVIDEWVTVVDADSDAAKAALLNLMMAKAAAYPRLVDHDLDGWHLHYRDDRQTLPEVLRSVIAVGTSLHLATRGMHRLSRCASEPCRNVITDITRNGRQRYCSVRCGNRASVRRHRDRLEPRM